MDFRPNVAVDKTGLCASTKTLSKSGFIRTSFDFSIFVTEYALIIYRLTAIDHLNDGFGGIFRFLTIWNFTLQAFYFGLCLLTDLVEGEKPPGEKRGMLQHCRDLLHSILFSMTFHVVLGYWSIYAIDPQLIDIPNPQRPGFRPTPFWFKNWIMHSEVIIFMLLDKWMSFHRYPRRLYGCLATLCLASLYTLWFVFQSWYANYWSYAFVKKLDVTPRVFVYIGGTSVFIPWYLLGEAITKLIWRKQISRITMNITSQRQSVDRVYTDDDEAEKQKEEETKEASVRASVRLSIKTSQHPCASSRVRDSGVDLESRITKTDLQDGASSRKYSGLQ